MLSARRGRDPARRRGARIVRPRQGHPRAATARRSFARRAAPGGDPGRPAQGDSVNQRGRNLGDHRGRGRGDRFGPGAHRLALAVERAAAAGRGQNQPGLGHPAGRTRRTHRARSGAAALPAPRLRIAPALRDPRDWPPRSVRGAAHPGRVGCSGCQPLRLVRGAGRGGSGCRVVFTAPARRAGRAGRADRDRPAHAALSGPPAPRAPAGRGRAARGGAGSRRAGRDTFRGRYC